MNQIEEIITDVLKAEGWDRYTDHPADRGGPTKWGITLRAWGEYLGQEMTPADVRAITETGAREFYRKRYVVDPHFHHLPAKLMALIVDCGVNHGTRCATKWLQRAVGVKQDGILGPITLAKVQAAEPFRTYVLVCAFRIKLYGRLVSRDHSQAVFAAGWNNRAAKWLIFLSDQL